MADFAHPSVDELADLAEGVLPEERIRDVSGHLASCADCTQVTAALEEVQATLALAGSTPEPIPESVSRTLDAALQRASAERAARADVPSLAERRNRPPRPVARQRPPRWAVIAGAAAAVIVVGYAGSNLLNNGGGTNSSADQGAPADAAGGAAGSGRDPNRAEGSGQPPGKAAEDVVTPRTLAGYATRLVAGRGYFARPAATCRATVRTPAGTSVATVRWKGHRAAVVADPSSHRVKVYACSDSAILFSTTY